jgi:quercetin dioxygenase-like cupin family protein
MAHFSSVAAHVGSNAERWHKAEIFRSANMLIGVDCLEVGQQQAPHLHHGRDKCYYIVEGEAEFTIDGETQRLAAGELAWAAAGLVHGVRNVGTSRLTMLIAMAPEPN